MRNLGTNAFRECEQMSKGCLFCSHKCFDKLKQIPCGTQKLDSWRAEFVALSKLQQDRELLWIFGRPHTSQTNTSLTHEFESQETSDESAEAMKITHTSWPDDVEPPTEITTEESGPDDMDMMVDAGGSTLPWMRMYSK